jgi:hypothetical protein
MARDYILPRTYDCPKAAFVSSKVLLPLAAFIPRENVINLFIYFKEIYHTRRKYIIVQVV